MEMILLRTACQMSAANDLWCYLDYKVRRRGGYDGTREMVLAPRRRGAAETMSSVAQDLGALYLQHRDAMYSVAASVLRDVGRASEAGDAVNDAIASIMASPPQNIRNWEAFLVTAAKRKALDRVRSAAVVHAGPEFVESTHDRPDDTDVAQDVAEDLDQQERAALLRDCLSVLDPRHRHAVWEVVALGRSRSEVAAELGVSGSSQTRV